MTPDYLSNLSTTTELPEKEEGSWNIPFGVDIVVGLIIGVAVLFAVVGNTCIILSFIRDKELRDVYNIFILNLAITDLIIGMFSMPIYAVYTLNDFTWKLGYVFCKVFLAIDYTVCLQSALAIVLISLDRLIMIKRGAFYFSKETAGVAVCKIACSWIFAFSFYGPAIIGWDFWTGESSVDDGQCDVEFATNTIYTTVTAVLEFACPFTAILIINSLIFYELTSKRRFPVRTAPNEEGVFTVADKKARPHSSSLTTHRHRRMAKVLATLVVTFGVLWVPYTISAIMFSVCQQCVNNYFFEASSWLLWLKASINPFLYAFLIDRYRSNIRDIFSKIFCRKAKPIPGR